MKKQTETMLVDTTGSLTLLDSMSGSILIYTGTDVVTIDLPVDAINRWGFQLTIVNASSHNISCTAGTVLPETHKHLICHGTTWYLG